MTATAHQLDALQATWAAHWEKALEAWSRFTKLRPPRWCLTAKAAKREGLEGSFAMIRLTDTAVVINLADVNDKQLQGFAVEVLAHEIGHHVYAPGDLRDNARLAARIRRGLPGQERWAGLVANLYTDLLINDRLQREIGLDMAGVYRRLASENATRLWSLYLRIYEHLWRLPTHDLGPGETDEDLLTDALLGARVVRAYAREWLGGGGRFAALLLPYIQQEQEQGGAGMALPWLDAMSAGQGGELPEGLTAMDADEIDGAIHPILDNALSGVDSLGSEEGGGAATIGGVKNTTRSPSDYTGLMKSLGVQIPENELVRRYYRELAIPHLIPFPTKELMEATDPLPEGLDTWDPGSALADVDWVETVVRSPVVIPGVTTLERRMGVTQGGTPNRVPPDLYLGVDCSGSMGNPAHRLSYPVLAGTVIVLSALRVRARVKVTLSGEPGKFTETEGFLSDENRILNTLTSYLGTGYAYGVLRLHDTFLAGVPLARPTHALVVTDSDLFTMLDRTENGWEIARRAAEAAGAGATAALEISNPVAWAPQLQRLRDCGWHVHLVNDRESLVAFARAFARLKFGEAA